ncbi:MAG: HNH endonuclease [Barrevirus sp.]|uniref:HNH endonuclease n=1 Tax=Barrevirus sp. TaxID=2487763 RepID=A0A3G4ZQC8_9VIRU|nr:MAG: HNH endonuclease [Barrevirus sp.]
MKLRLGGIKGGETLVDKEDYPLLSTISWVKDNKNYVSGDTGTAKVKIHNFIMNPPKGYEVDHIDRNPLNNQRSNLRLLPMVKNREHKSKREGATSKYRGVVKAKDKFAARAKYGCRTRHLGTFDTELEAAQHRDLFIVKNDVEHLGLNFPDDREKYLKTEFVSKVRAETSKYVGVSKEGNSFKAASSLDGKQHYLGSFATETLAAQRYDKFVVDNNIPHRKLNFPEMHPTYNPETIKTLCEPLDATTVRLIINKNEGDADKVVKIDLEDYDKVKYYECNITPNNTVDVSIPDAKISLHRLVMKPKEFLIQVDHINSNPLDNTKKNLRFSNYQLNSQNKSKRKGDNTSDYFGVMRIKGKTWAGRIQLNYQRVYYQEYDDEEWCARGRDLHIILHLKDTHFKLNFEWTEKSIAEWRAKLNV